MCHKVCFASLVFLAVSQCAFAQPGDRREQQSLELRSQIDRLEQKLRELEDTDKEKRGITQIGNSTLRTSDDARLVVRMYDLSELFTVAPPYAARQQSDLTETEKNLFPQVTVQTTTPSAMGGGFGGGFGGAFSVPDRPKSVANPRPTHLAQVEARSSVNNLVSAIQSTISPSSWDSVGGPMSITQFGNALLVSADANTHSQIEKLLDLFNKRWGTLKTVTVQAWWVPLGDDQLAELLSPNQNAPAAAKPPFGVVDEVAFKKLLSAQREANGSTGYRAAITCYNGQTVNTVAGGESLAVTGLGAVPAAASANAAAKIGYSPVVSLIQEGAALQVTPIVTTSGKYVVLDIHSRVARRQATDQRPRAEGRAEAAKTADGPALAGDVVAALDRPQLVAQRLSTTLRVPIDRTMLVGGMTMSNNPAAAEPALYLFVKLVVQELRERAQDEPASEVKPDADEQNGTASDGTSAAQSNFGGRR
jgi:hypothetical protein